MTKGSRTEIKCDACDGSGSQPVRQPEPRAQDLSRSMYEVRR